MKPRGLLAIITVVAIIAAAVAVFYYRDFPRMDKELSVSQKEIRQRPNTIPPIHKESKESVFQYDREHPITKPQP